MQLPYIQLPQSRAPEIIGDMGNTLVEAARRKQEAEQQAAQLLMQKQRLAADESRMRAEEHRAAAQEERAMSAEKRNADAVERQQRLEAAQFIQQAPGMLDPKAPGYNPSLFQALGQVHGANYSLQQPNLPPAVGNPGAAPQEPQSPMVGPLETPEQARLRAMYGGHSGLASNTLIAGKYPGLLGPGNVNLTDRPNVANADGSHSSVRSMSFGSDGREVLVPTVSEDGRIMSDEEAMRQYDQTGRHLGMFRDPASATRYASSLHQQQESAGQGDRGKGDAAMQEVLKQQAERDQYQQALAAHPDLVKQHAEQVNQFKAYQAAKAQADANPVYNLHTPFGDSTLDFGQRHQAQAAQQQQAQAATEQAYGPEYAKLAAMAQQMGVTDPNALAGMLNKAHEADTKRAEQEKLRADANAEKEKLAQQYQMTAGQKYAVGMTGANSRGATAQHADDRQARTQFHQDLATDAKIIEKEYKAPYVESAKALKFIDTQPENPETWIAARDFFVKTISGGKVTKAQYDQAASHSAPAYDKLSQLFEAATTGKPSDIQRKNLRDAIEAINKVAKGGLQEKEREFSTTYGEDPLVAGGDKTAKGTYDRHAKRLFSETEEPKTKPANPLVQAANHPKTAPVGEIKVAPNGKTYRKVGPNDWQLVND